MQKYIRYHIFSLVVAILYGLLLASPAIFHPGQALVNDENFYLARIQDVIDGHPFLSNAYLLEHKDGPPQQLFLAEFLLAQPLKLLHISVAIGRTLYTGLFSALVFLLVYFIFFQITKLRSRALYFAVTLMFGFMMVRMLRPVSPQFNIIFFLTQFIFLWKTFETDFSKKWLIYSGINLGLLFYIYPYYWTYYVVLLALLILKFRKVWPVLALAGVISIPYWMMMVSASKLPEYAESLSRIGLISTRFPSGINVILWSLPVLILAAIFVKQKKLTLDKFVWFLGAGLVASIVVVNQHLITGKNMEFSSHYVVGAMLIAFFAVSYISKSIKPIWLVLIGIILVVRGIWLFVDPYLLPRDTTKSERYRPVIAWINEHVPRDSVVFADAHLSELIPAYTSANVWSSRNANIYFISDQEVIDRVLINHFFDKIDEQWVGDHERELFGVRYVDIYGHKSQKNKLRKFLGLDTRPPKIIPDEAVALVLDRAKQIHKKSFIENLARYQADYVISSSSQIVLGTLIAQVGE